MKVYIVEWSDGFSESHICEVFHSVTEARKYVSDYNSCLEEGEGSCYYFEWEVT